MHIYIYIYIYIYNIYIHYLRMYRHGVRKRIFPICSTHVQVMLYTCIHTRVYKNIERIHIDTIPVWLSNRGQNSIHDIMGKPFVQSLQDH